MKKMSLKIAQGSLSRDEMRMITGGSGGGDGCSDNICGSNGKICCKDQIYHCVSDRCVSR